MRFIAVFRSQLLLRCLDDVVARHFVTFRSIKRPANDDAPISDLSMFRWLDFSHIKGTDDVFRTQLAPTNCVVLRRPSEAAGGVDFVSSWTENALKKHHRQYDRILAGPQSQSPPCFPGDRTNACLTCNSLLWPHLSEFMSAWGKPQFHQGVSGSIKQKKWGGSRRVEVICARCDGQLGYFLAS